MTILEPSMKYAANANLSSCRVRKNFIKKKDNQFTGKMSTWLSTSIAIVSIDIYVIDKYGNFCHPNL